MITFREHRGVVPSFVLFVVVALSGWSTGCSSGPYAQPESDPFKIDVRSDTVTVVNRSGAGVENVRISIVPAGPVTFLTMLSRLESGQERSFNISNFRGTDGSRLSLSVTKPRSVK